MCNCWHHLDRQGPRQCVSWPSRLQASWQGRAGGDRHAWQLFSRPLHVCRRLPGSGRGGPNLLPLHCAHHSLPLPLSINLRISSSGFCFRISAFKSIVLALKEPLRPLFQLIVSSSRTSHVEEFEGVEGEEGRCVLGEYVKDCSRLAGKNDASERMNASGGGQGSALSWKWYCIQE